MCSLPNSGILKNCTNKYCTWNIFPNTIFFLWHWILRMSKKTKQTFTTTATTTTATTTTTTTTSSSSVIVFFAEWTVYYRSSSSFRGSHVVSAGLMLFFSAGLMLLCQQVSYCGFRGSHVVLLLVNKYPDYFIVNLDKVGGACGPYWHSKSAANIYCISNTLWHRHMCSAKHYLAQLNAEFQLSLIPVFRIVAVIALTLWLKRVIWNKVIYLWNLRVSGHIS